MDHLKELNNFQKTQIAGTHAPQEGFHLKSLSSSLVVITIKQGLMNMCAGVCVEGVLLIEYNQMKSRCSAQMGVEV